nr:DUF6471 domain-containing protein [Cupriavidus sp. AcVe19-6a]
MAARTARAILTRKDVSVDEFANRISAMGVPETFRGAESKFQRGTYSLAYFLLLLHAANSEYPREWAKFIDSDESWESAASHVFLYELKRQALSIEELCQRLETIAVHTRPEKLTAHIEGGGFPFTLLLQTASVAPIPELIRFVDQNDLAEAADKFSTMTSKKSGR